MNGRPYRSQNYKHFSSHNELVDELLSSFHLFSIDEDVTLDYDLRERAFFSDQHFLRCSFKVESFHSLLGPLMYFDGKGKRFEFFVKKHLDCEMQGKYSLHCLDDAVISNLGFETILMTDRAKHRYNQSVYKGIITVQINNPLNLFYDSGNCRLEYKTTQEDELVLYLEKVHDSFDKTLPLLKMTWVSER